MLLSRLPSAKFAALLIATSACATPGQAANSIQGDWITEDRDAIVRISQCGAKLCGRIHKYLVTPPDGIGQKDIYNPDKSKRNRTLLGMAILTGFARDGKKWRGKIYDPKSGKTYRSEVSLGSPGKLKVRGCILFICLGETWTRT